jgi:O-antigen/teichoic acid export membrane protein
MFSIKKIFARLSHSVFARNWSMLFLSGFFSQVLGMVALIRVARILMPAGYGKFNLVQSIASIGFIIASLGFRQVIIRESARYPEKSSSILFSSLIIRVISGVITAFGVLIYIYFANNGLTFSFAYIAIVLLGGQLLWDSVESIAFGHQRMQHSSSINMAGSVLWVIMVWIVPAWLLTPLIVSAAFAFLQLFKAGIYFIVGKKYRLYQFLILPGDVFGNIRSLISGSLPFYWLALLTSVTNQIPILLLAQRSGSAEVGLYNIGFRLLNPLQMLIQTAIVALYPMLAKYERSQIEQFMKMVKRALIGLCVIGTISALAISLIRTEVVVVLFGKGYLPSADAMMYQCWYTLIYAIFCLIGTVLAARDKQRWLAWLSTVYAIITMPILWYASASGAKGLAIGIVIAAILNFTYHWYYFEKSLPAKLPLKYLASIVALIGSGMVLSWSIPVSVPFILRLMIFSTLVFSTVGIVIKYPSLARSLYS